VDPPEHRTALEQAQRGASHLPSPGEGCEGGRARHLDPCSKRLAFDYGLW
jgi:hypothetical protein